MVQSRLVKMRDERMMGCVSEREMESPDVFFRAFALCSLVYQSLSQWCKNPRTDAATTHFYLFSKVLYLDIHADGGEQGITGLCSADLQQHETI